MGLSRITFPGDGVQDTFNVVFALGQISNDDVTAYVEGEVDGLGDPILRPITFLSDTSMRIGGDIPSTAGKIITFDRTVDKEELIVDYEDGDIINDENLNTSQKQMLMAVHETLDGRFSALAEDLDAGGNRIINVADPIDPTDASNKQYTDSRIADGAANAAAAAASAAASATSAGQAATFRNQAEASRTAADVAAGQAAGYRTEAQTLRNQAAGFAEDAQDAAVAANQSAIDASNAVVSSLKTISDMGSAVYTTATINAMLQLSVTSSNNVISEFPNGSTVSSITWAGDSGVSRPRDVIVRNGSTTTSITVTLSNSIRSSALGASGTVTIPPLGVMVLHSFLSGFWMITSGHGSGGGGGGGGGVIDTGFGAREVLLRDFLANPAAPSPTAAQWTAALQAAHNAVAGNSANPGCGTIYFSEPITLTGPIDWYGYVSLKGVAYVASHRFANPEPYLGAMILGPNGVNLGNTDFGGRASNFPNALINVFTDTTIIPNSTSRPRLNIVFENFGMYGNGMTFGSAIRVAGSMYVNARNLSIMWFPSWGFHASSRTDISPGSANGCRLEDLLITSCGTAGVDMSGGILWGSPDSHFENVQVGGNMGVGIHYYFAGNCSAEQCHVWDNNGDNVRMTGAEYLDFHGLVYDCRQSSNIAIMSNCRNIRLSGIAWNPNHQASTDPRLSSGVYIAASAKDIVIDMLIDGQTSKYSWTDNTAWASGQTIAVGAFRVHQFRLYQATTAGTTGATAPTHTSGTASDGGVTWRFHRGFGRFGVHDAGDGSTPGNITINIQPINNTLYNCNVPRPGLSGNVQNTVSVPNTGTFPLAPSNNINEVYDFILKRRGVQDSVFAQVVGGPSPDINKRVIGTTIDIANSGGYYRITNSTSGNVTVDIWKERRIS